MIYQQINQLFPLRKLLYLLLAIAIGIQLVIVSYNHFTGFYILDGPGHFFFRLLRGIGMSLVAGLFMALPDILIVHLLNRTLAWSSQTAARLLVQVLLTIIVGLLVSLLLTLFSNMLTPYRNPLSTVLRYNALIFSVANLLLMAIIEGVLAFLESRQAVERAKTLEQELSQIRFEVLKKQINPHFLFNSLNVLSSLIRRDPEKAQDFIDEFSYIYRYVLETIEQPLVPLKRELQFVRSYFFLQQIRYGEALQMEIDLPAELLSWQLPPLSLQVVLENTVKHNIVDEEHPLTVELYAEQQALMVKNNLQPRLSSGFSAKLGQENLIKRYLIAGGQAPSFQMGTQHYLARLHLIAPGTA